MAETSPGCSRLLKTFPDTVAIKNKGHLFEFCPDGTCDGFVTSGNFFGAQVEGLRLFVR